MCDPVRLTSTPSGTLRAADGDGIGDRQRDLGIRLDVLELSGEERRRRQIDPRSVVERDQRVRDRVAARIDDRQLADEGRVEELLDGFGKGGHWRLLRAV